tara:strand:+ start:315 stop:539 length:225 start_codon:yes stop_codon:yes gene_type:complete
MRYITIASFLVGVMLLGCEIEDKIEKAADRCEDKVAKALENIEDACLTKEEIIELLYSLRDNPNTGTDGGICDN